MRTSFLAQGMTLLMVAGFMSGSSAMAGESTMPEGKKYLEIVKPEVAAKYVYTEGGQYTKSLGIPTYEWMPAQGTPKAMVMAIHGLTLHGRRFRVLARSLAVNGIGFVSMDMRGFGQCKFDDKKQFSTKDDDRTEINHEKSYTELVKLATMIKANYPDKRLIAMGESLGCTFCVRLAAEHPDLIDAVVLSAPAVKVNKDMYRGNGQIKDGIAALFKRDHEMDLRGFFAELCSNRKNVQDEMIDDPFILKQVRLGALISTDKFVDKTAKWGMKTDPHLSVLILQGSSDGCVNSKHVTDLMNNMPSDDQNLAWRGHFGHIQLETMFMRAASIDAIGSFLMSHGRDGRDKLKVLEGDIADLGGTVTK